MKRKICSRNSSTDIMEELNVTALSERKESVAPLTERDGRLRESLGYPLALILRLRVLQIVCGISAVVMGCVAFIEERRQFNISLGIPAGVISILAAAVSIHTSRGWSAMTSGAGSGAGVAGMLWAIAACFMIALVVQCSRTIFDPTTARLTDEQDVVDSQPSPRDLIIIACVQIALATATIVSAVICLKLELTR